MNRILVLTKQLPTPAKVLLITFFGFGIIGLSLQVWEKINQRSQQKDRHFFVSSVAKTGKYTIVTWPRSVTNQQFWLDGTAANAFCNPRTDTCMVPERDGVQEVYFRWFDPSDARWHEFRCPGTYFGAFPPIQPTS